MKTGFDQQGGTRDYPHMIFAYGTLKENQTNHNVIKHGEGLFVGYAKTKRKMSMGGNGHFPFVAPKPALYEIQGELWAVSQQTLDQIDKLERHPTFLRRTETDIMLPEGEVTAWIYLACNFLDTRRYVVGHWPSAKNSKVANYEKTSAWQR